MSPAPYRIAVFASGTGTNLSAIMAACADGRIAGEVAMVLVSRATAGACERAEAAGVSWYHIARSTHADPEARDAAILERLHDHRIDLIALAGYVKKISSNLIASFGRPIVNIHPALLPAFGGKGMYGTRVFESVLEYGVKLTGVTVHLVDEQYDHGPVVAQRAIEVLEDDTPERLARRIHGIEHEVFPEVIGWFAAGRVHREGRRVRVAPVASEGRAP